MSTSTVDLSAGLVPAAASPSGGGVDLSSGLTPKADYSSLTHNPKGEGTYDIKAPDGQKLAVPYSNVPVFTQNMQGAGFATPEDAARFQKDADADPHKPTFWNALTNPVGSGGQQQGVAGGALQIGGQAINTMAQPIAHPIQTAQGIGQTIAHPVQAVQGVVNKYQQDQAQGGNALALENLGGQALGTVESGRVAPAAIDAAANTGRALTGRALLMGSTPEAAYLNKLKASTTFTPAEKTALAQTGLENSVPISPGGVQKIGSLIDDLNQKIKGTIAQDPTRPIDPNAVAQRLGQTSNRFANQVVAQPDLNAIDATRQQFLAERGATPGSPGTPPRPTGVLNAQGQPIMTGGTPPTPPTPAPPMNAIDAQAMKQGTYQVLKGKYGEQGSATVEAQKGLARGLKEEIATQFPEINQLNASESKLLDLQPVLERAVSRISNHESTGLGTPAIGMAADAMGASGPVAGAAMVIRSVLSDAAVRSRLAIAVSKMNKIPVSAALSKIDSYSTALGATSAGSSALAPQGYPNGGTPNQQATPQP